LATIFGLPPTAPRHPLFDVYPRKSHVIAAKIETLHPLYDILKGVTHFWVHPVVKCTKRHVYHDTYAHWIDTYNFLRNTQWPHSTGGRAVPCAAYYLRHPRQMRTSRYAPPSSHVNQIQTSSLPKYVHASRLQYPRTLFTHNCQHATMPTHEGARWRRVLERTIMMTQFPKARTGVRR